MFNLENTFHPITATWFKEKFDGPTDPQIHGWPKIATGEHTLIAAPTGMGKTLTAFFCLIDQLLRLSLAGRLEESCRVLYISPLKALGNDIHKNLLSPLEEIGVVARRMGYPAPSIRVAVRSGDTTTRERRLMLTRPPHILITTPESFHILLCAEKSREILKSARTVIVDEIHAVAGDKRGAHLSLSLERLERLTEKPPQRIGLSATQKPISRMAQMLVGQRFRKDGELDCHIVDVGSHRKMDLTICVADNALGPIATHEYWAQVYELLLKNIAEHRTTIIFTHTRRLVERIAHQLSEELGKEKVAAHHGSLSKEVRLKAEQDLKAGEIPVIVSSASLELGIDIGTVDLVIHIGCPRVIASLLQRIGRSGHITGATPKGIVYPLTTDELLQSAAAVRAVRQGRLDEIVFQDHPLDVLCQIIVAESAAGEISVQNLWELARKSYTYRELPRKDFDEVLAMLAEGIATQRGRAGAYIHYDRVNEIISGRRNARLAAITSGGTILQAAEYDVIQEPDELFIGKVNEDFAIESMAGNIFLLGNRSWRIVRVEKNRVRVVDAEGAPPNIPFWFGEAPSRTYEMSEALAELRIHIAANLADKARLEKWLQEETMVSALAARQMISYIEDNVKILGAVPSLTTLIAERFFDEAGGMQLILHTPFGGRINRAWGLAMRKRFCLTFDFELQCAATDDGLVFSLGEQHSFPLESVWHYLNSETLEEDLIHAVLPHPIFLNRFRWNAGRALAVLRFQGGKRVPIHLQRMKSDDLLASVFPAHVGCQDNRDGPIEPADHPLVNETLENCLHEAMDVDGLRDIVEKIKSGRLTTLAIDTTSPSPFSHEILNAAPYAFLDDAPLEERRSRAVSLRRFNPEDELGKLDSEVIVEITQATRPEFRNANELHDFLVTLCLADDAIVGDYPELLKELQASNRLSPCAWSGAEGKRYEGYVPAERVNYVRAACSDFKTLCELPVLPPLKNEIVDPSPEDGVNLLLQGWMEILGPVTEACLADRFGLKLYQVSAGLAYLESKGLVLQGQFSEPCPQWCSRTLLMRIHQRTLQKLRKQVEPVTPADYMRFLLRWQHVHPKARLAGDKGVLECIYQLQGMEFPLSSWEEKILARRLREGNVADLETHFLNGTFVWCRMSSGQRKPESDEEIKQTRLTKNFPFAILARENIAYFISYSIDPERVRSKLTGVPAQIYEFLYASGASFMNEITAAVNQLQTAVEEGLKDLISMGLISSDGISGIKKLSRSKALVRESRRPARRFRSFQSSLSGRWYLWHGNKQELPYEERLEAWVHQLLWRYGILIREVTLRESVHFPWWQILVTLRRMEARGEIRGGRFVRGISGEQFATPEALEALKPIRRVKDADIIAVSAADPLNLVGIIVPGPKIPVNSPQLVVYKGGEFLMTGLLGEVNARLKNEQEYPVLASAI